jgi:ribosomal protein S18 acetylase RimI-like enzyme
MEYLKDHSFHNIPVHIYMIKAPEERLMIRNLENDDLNKLAHTFNFPWSNFEATLKLWQQWYKEQQEGIRTVCVLERQNQFLGYGSLLRSSEYPFFRKNGIPEVNAIWIDASCRKQGLAKMLIEHLEDIACNENYATIGIGVGLYKDYGPAQRLYFKMGYQPDGNGITYKGNWVKPGTSHPVDDELLIWLSKPLVKK